MINVMVPQELRELIGHEGQAVISLDKGWAVCTEK